MAADSSSLALQSQLHLVEGAVPGRLAIALCVLLTLACVPLPAAADAFDPSSSTFALRGMAARKNPGTPGGAAWGHVTFDAAGEVAGGTLTRIDGTTGTFTSADSSFDVTGRAVSGLFGTGTNPTSLLVTGVAATDDLLVLSTETPINPDFPGMLVGVRQVGSFEMSDLEGATWRFKALGVRLPAAGGEGGWASGSLTLAAGGSVTGGDVAFSAGSPGPITTGALSITAQGAVTGNFNAQFLGACLGGVAVDGAMTPDKTLIAAVIKLSCDGIHASGMAIFQRDPGATTYATADLAGTYDFIGIDQQDSDDDNLGAWARGTVTFDGTGEVTGGLFDDPDASTTVPEGFVDLSTQGLACSGISPCSKMFTLSSDVELRGTMTTDKSLLFGVWTRMDGSVEHTAFFAWIKRAVPIIEFSASTYSRREANTPAAITVTRSGDTAAAVTVDYATATATSSPATDGADYTATSGTLTFATGETTKTFAVTLLDDTELEPTERVKLVLSSPTSGAVLGSLATADIRITNDDSVVQLSAAALNVGEGAGVTSVLVTRTGFLNSTATVAYTITAGTATAGVDFTAATGTLTLPAGDGGASIPLTVLQDTLDEGPETIHITLSSPSGDITLGAPAIMEVTILDDDDAGTLAFARSTYTTTEDGGAAVIRVLRSGGSASGVSVHYATSNGSAAAGADYTATSGALTFDAGEMEKTFTIAVLDDTALESTETVSLALTSPGGGGSLGTQSTARLRILDDDSVVQLSAAAFTRAESAGATSVQVTRTGYRGAPATVEYTIGGGTATAGLDYTAATGVLSFAAGVSSVPLPVTILQDTLAEGPETIEIVLDAPTGAMQLGVGASTVTIADDDEAGTLAFSAPIYTGTEGGPAVVVTVVRSGGAASGVTVDYATSNGTASAGADYAARTGTLTFGAGQTSKTVRVPLLDDAAVELTEVAGLALTDPAGGASLGAQSTATLRILDNDSLVNFNAPAFLRPESAGGTSVLVTRTGYRGAPATVAYTIDGGTATAGLDYTAAGGVLSFAAGVMSVPLPLTILQDSLAEGPETIEIALSAPTGSMLLGTNTSASVTILDDDAAGTLAFSAPTYTGTEGDAAVVVTVVRSGGAASGVTVDYATSDGTAVAGADYAARTGTLTFGAGQTSKTLRVPLVDDAALEGTEGATLTLSNPAGGASLGTQSAATLRIVDNESVVRFGAAAFTRGESAGATSVAVTRTGYRGAPATVAYTIGGGTATAGLDYTAATGVLSFAAGVISVPLPFTILQDTLAEEAETVEITLSAPTGSMHLGANAGTAVTIMDDDVAGRVAFSAETYRAGEGGAAVITVVRSGGAASGVTVQYATSNGTARAGRDYTATAGTLTFAAGQMSRTFTVPVTDDVAVEGRERVNLTLSNPTGGASLAEPFTAALRLADNDSTVQIDAAAYTRAESAGATAISVVRTGALGSAATVRYTVTGGTATAGLDYTAAATGILTFPAGVATRIVPITIVQDAVVEPPETLAVVLSDATGAMRLGSTVSAVLTITDDDTGGVIAFASSTYTATEGGSAAVITVVRSGGAAGGVTVRYATSDDTAIAGADYTAASGTLTFAAGDTTATFIVPVTDDTVGEANERVRLSLSSPAGGASVGAPATAWLTIRDNEPVVAFTGAWVGRGFEVARTGPADTLVTVEYATIDGTAIAGVDYRPLAGTLTFAPGITSQLITVRILRDTIPEGPETFTLFLRNPVGARLGDFSSQVMVIKDND